MDDLQVGELICPAPDTIEDAHVLGAIIWRQVRLGVYRSSHALQSGWEVGDWQSMLEDHWRSYFAPEDKRRIITHWVKHKLR